MIKYLLASSLIRSKVLKFLKDYFYHEFEVSIPLSNNYWAHLLENDSYDSFSEIFIKKEYENYLPESFPDRILDIGANYGFFSLWLQSVNPHKKLFSLLVEPSTSCTRSISKMINANNLNDRFFHIKRVIDDNSDKFTHFYDRAFMSSSRDLIDENEIPYSVKVFRESDITQYMKMSFDLIKCDIEGAEWDLIAHYPNVLKSTKYLTIEWHSWHRGGGGLDQILTELDKLGFSLVRKSKVIPAVGREGKVGLIFAENTNFES